LDYIHQNYLPKANQSVINTVAQLYPSDPAAGSPFDTGDANAVTPEFKRLAAFQGDLVFQAPRRFFINERSSKQPIWAFCMILFCLRLAKLNRCS
jgi:acetylcholinesterase